ncbi:ankyrin repeat family protein / regulator of chromosome condensation (RCC1) family protein [Wolffia australiana]
MIQQSVKDIWSAAREGSLSDLDSAIYQLKKSGVNINAKNASGLTALHIATWRNHLPIVKRLLSAGADPDVRDGESGWSSLHRALHFGHFAVAGVLLQSGATITLEDTKSRTPVDLISGPVCQSIGKDRHSIVTEVFSWGSGTNYQLGTGNAHMQKLPCKVDALHGTYIKMSAAGKFHSVAVGSCGELYTWGFGRGGRLGLPDFDIHSGQSAVITPHRVTVGLGSRRVYAIAAAKHHTVVTTENGEVYTWGSNREGQLGYPSVDTQATPRRVSSLRSRIVSVAAANKHSAAVSESGEVFTWGCNKDGQLGYGTSNSASNCIPRLVESLKGRNLKAVSAAKYHTVVLGVDGEVFTWGHKLVNPKRVIIARNARKGGGLPMVFHRSGRLQIVAIAAGMAHSTAVADDGSVFYWTSSDPDLRCHQLHSLRGKEVVSVSAGKYWTAAATSTGDVYMLDGKKYKDTAPTPTRIHGIKNVTSVSVGETHLLFICGLYHPPSFVGLEGGSQKTNPESCNDLEEFDADFIFDDPLPKSNLAVVEECTGKPIPSLKSLCEKTAAKFLMEPRNAISLLEIADSLEANDLWSFCEDIAIRNIGFIFTISASSVANTSSEVLAKLEKAMEAKSLEHWSHRRLPLPTAAAFPAIILGEEDEICSVNTYESHSKVLENSGRHDLEGSFLPSDATDFEIVKQVRAIRKKLQQIEILEEKRSRGQTLDDQQVAKLQSRPILESTLADLGFPVELHQKSSPSIQEDIKGQKKKNKGKKTTADSQKSKVKTKQQEDAIQTGVPVPDSELELLAEKVTKEECCFHKKEEEETLNPAKEAVSDPPACSRIISKKKNKKGGLSMFLSGALDNTLQIVQSPPPPPPKKEGPAWGGAARISKDLSSLREIQQEQSKFGSVDHARNSKMPIATADKGGNSGRTMLGSVGPLSPSSPIRVGPSDRVATPPDAGRSPPPWSSSGSSPILSRPSLRDIQMQQAKKQLLGMAHSPRSRTSGFTVPLSGPASPSETTSPSYWFKPEMDVPSSIRSIQIEEKAMKDLKQRYSCVKLIRPCPNAS